MNASAQTPAGQLHGDSHSFEFSDEQNAGESGSDSDSDSESGNSDNEVRRIFNLKFFIRWTFYQNFSIAERCQWR